VALTGGAGWVVTVFTHDLGKEGRGQLAGIIQNRNREQTLFIFGDPLVEGEGP
jgi:hypothetical protein